MTRATKTSLPLPSSRGKMMTIMICISLIGFLTTNSNTTIAFAKSSSSTTGCAAFVSSPFSPLSSKATITTTTTSTRAFVKSSASFLTVHNRHHHHHQQQQQSVLFMSSIGGGGNYNDESNQNNGNPDDPTNNNNESENLRQARAKISEERLPISFHADTTQNNHMKDHDNDNNYESTEKESETNENSGAIELSRNQITPSSSQPEGGGPLAQNPYLQVISSVGPSELISKFTQSAHPRVQDAVKSTILGLLGNLPKMAFETTAVTTAERLASLMFQLQMTGYMFKNAEYRLSLTQSLGMDDDMSSTAGGSSGSRLLSGDVAPGGANTKKRRYADGGKVKGKIRVRYDIGNNDDNNNDNNNKAIDNKESKQEETTTTATNNQKENKQKTGGGMEIEVDAAAYMSELRSEVSRLKEELQSKRNERQEAIRKDLLLYIRTLPEKEMRELTGTVSPEVLQAMKGLVNAVLGGISAGADANLEEEERGGGGGGVAMGGGGVVEPDTVTEQSGEAMAQLCMWQLVVGYNLRELEVRESMKRSLLEGVTKGKNVTDGGGDDDGDGYGYDLSDLGLDGGGGSGGGFE